MLSCTYRSFVGGALGLIVSVFCSTLCCAMRTVIVSVFTFLPAHALFLLFFCCHPRRNASPPHLFMCFLPGFVFHKGQLCRVFATPSVFKTILEFHQAANMCKPLPERRGYTFQLPPFDFSANDHSTALPAFTGQVVFEGQSRVLS